MLDPTNVAPPLAPLSLPTQPSAADAAEMTFVQKVADAVPDILYVYDVREGRNIYCNREIAAVLGYSPQEVLEFGTDLFARLLHPDDFDAITRGHEQLGLGENGTVVEVSYRMRRRDGSWRWLRSRDTVFARDSQGTVVQKLGVARDVTAERQARQALMEAVERYRSLVSILTDWVWEVDTSAVYTYVSPQSADILGYNPSEMIGRHVYEFMPAADAARVRAAFDQAASTHGAFQVLKHVMVAKDGRAIYVEASGTPIFHARTGAWLGYRGVNRDITARHAMESEREALLEQTRQRADKDPLTGLLNRMAFERAFGEHLSKAANGVLTDVETVAVVLLDLDNLKFFNDAYGHSAGDDVLVFIADALRSCCAETDVLARRGGDEFAVILPGRNRSGAELMLSAMKTAVTRLGYRPPRRAGSLAEPVPIPLSVSGGVAILPIDGTTTASLLEAADARLYRDKTNAQVTWSESFRADLSADLAGFVAVDALVAAVAAKDRYTLRHSEDVLIYAALIGEELGMSSHELHALKVAALLHDSGKVGVADRLLRLPGPLSPDEYEAVKLHAALGAALVESAAPEIALRMPSVVPAIRHHHERWDGGDRGYPDRLAGESIPMHARILAVADAFSSMTTDRPYRQGTSFPEAFARLRAGAGSQWDSRCVAALIQAQSAAFDVS